MATSLRRLWWQLALALDLQAPGSHLEEVVPGVTEAHGAHARDGLAGVHQVDTAVDGAEHGLVDPHRRRKAATVDAHVSDAAWAQVFHLDLEHRVTAGRRHARVDGLHLDAGRAAWLAVGTCCSVRN